MSSDFTDSARPPATPSSDATTPPLSTTNATPALPESEFAGVLVSTVFEMEDAAIANHSMRTYLFARVIAAHRGLKADLDFDDTLLFAACSLHDIGLSAGVDGPQRFEVEGADYASRELRSWGFLSGDVNAVWYAIALHTSGGIAERQSLLCTLVREGVGIDLGVGAEVVSDDQARAIHTSFPWLGAGPALTDAIVSQVQRRPSKAPRYSIADALSYEREVLQGTTRMEQGMARSRWADWWESPTDR